MAVKMMKVVAVVSVAMCLGTASAQQTISVNFGQQGTSEAPQTGGDTVKVQGRGVGATKEAALKDAYRDAIERAVGLYVDAETVVNNDQIVKDQVLTQSNAYITDYRELSSERIDVGFEVRILATVKKQALTTKLTSVMPAQTIILNNAEFQRVHAQLQNTHAQLVTKEKRAEDAAALLKNALEGLNPMQSLMVASIRPETQKILTGEAAKINSEPLPANQVMLRYLLEVKLDREKYFAEFVPNLKKVLDQISLARPKEIRLTELLPGRDSRSHSLQKFLEGTWDTWRSLSDAQMRVDGASGSLFGDLRLFKAFLDPVHVYSILWQGNNWVWRFGQHTYRPKTGDAFSWMTVPLQSNNFIMHIRKEKVLFALITQLKSDCSGGKVTMYELDKSVIPVLNAWRKGLIDKDEYGNIQKTTNYNIILLDKDGAELGVYPWQIPNGMLMNVKFAEIPNAGMVYATPFVGCFGESLIQWRDFVLSKDDLARIASIRIEPID